jgi:O-antigen ligase
LPPRHLWPVALLLLAAILLGGGGSYVPESELLLELLATPLALAMLFGPWKLASVPAVAPSTWAVAILVLLLPTLQLIPLPPGVWQALPGRGLEVEALRLVGLEQSWRPWSLFPDRTFAGLLSLIPPVILLLAVSRLAAIERRWLLALTVVMAFVSLALGALQLAGGVDSAMRLYSYTNPGFIDGFQANRNHEADVLLIGIAALGMLSPTVAQGRWTGRRGLAALGIAVLGLGVVLTGSRAGMAIMLPVLAAVGLYWVGRTRGAALVLPALGALAVAAGVLLQSNQAIQRVASRFAAQDDPRFHLWVDAVFAIKSYWPFGIGIAGAEPVLKFVERLDVLDVKYPNRVHNDFLELLLEAGIFGPLILIAIAAILVRAAMLRLRDSEAGDQAQVIAALVILAIVAMHSLVDYPLRSMSLAHLAALAAGIVLARRRETELVGHGGIT